MQRIHVTELEVGDIMQATDPLTLKVLHLEVQALQPDGDFLSIQGEWKEMQKEPGKLRVELRRAWFVAVDVLTRNEIDAKVWFAAPTTRWPAMTERDYQIQREMLLNE